MNPTLAQASRQGYVVTEELLTLVHVMEAQIKEPKRTEQHWIKTGHPNMGGGSPANLHNET
jgi:hypothetical protein